jgi:hypothetical protein
VKDILADAFTKTVKPTVNATLRRLFYKCEANVLSDLGSQKHEEKLHNAISKTD